MNSVTKKMVLNISMVCLLATSGVARCSDTMPATLWNKVPATLRDNIPAFGWGVTTFFVTVACLYYDSIVAFEDSRTQIANFESRDGTRWKVPYSIKKGDFLHC